MSIIGFWFMNHVLNSSRRQRKRARIADQKARALTLCQHLHYEQCDNLDCQCPCHEDDGGCQE